MCSGSYPLRKQVFVSICWLLTILDLPWPSHFLLCSVRLLSSHSYSTLQMPVPVSNVSSSQSSQITLLFVPCYVRETTRAFCSLLKSHCYPSSSKPNPAPALLNFCPNPAFQTAKTGNASGLRVGKKPKSVLEAWVLYSPSNWPLFFLSSLAIILEFSDVCCLWEPLKSNGWICNKICTALPKWY